MADLPEDKVKELRSTLKQMRELLKQALDLTRPPRGGGDRDMGGGG